MLAEDIFAFLYLLHITYLYTQVPGGYLRAFKYCTKTITAIKAANQIAASIPIPTQFLRSFEKQCENTKLKRQSFQ
jgi:hypothetical protein